MTTYEWIGIEMPDGTENLLIDIVQCSGWIDEFQLEMRKHYKKNTSFYREADWTPFARIYKWWNLVNHEILEQATPNRLQAKWAELRNWVEHFDQIRQDLSDTSVSKLYADKILWGAWRSPLGQGCGVDFENVLVTTKVQTEATELVPNWGTRHTYTVMEEEE